MFVLQCKVGLRCAFRSGIYKIHSVITTNVFDNNIQHPLHFSAPVVTTNCVWVIVLEGSVLCTELYLWTIWENVTSNPLYFET
jgi:hypothetical protein